MTLEIKEDEALVALYTRLYDKHEKLEKQHEYCQLLDEQWRQVKEENEKLRTEIDQLKGHATCSKAIEDSLIAKIADLESQISAAKSKMRRNKEKDRVSVEPSKSLVTSVVKLPGSRLGIYTYTEVVNKT